MPIPEGFYTVPPVGQFGAPRLGGRRHQGVDQYAPEGTASGLEMAATITGKGFNPDRELGFGHWVRYRHDDGYQLLEAHLMAPSPLVEGRRYPADTLVGRCGDTGNALRVGPHVHVEIRSPRGLIVDPLRYFARLQPAGSETPTPNPEKEEDEMKPFMIYTRAKTGTRWAVVSPDLQRMVVLTSQESANELGRRVTGSAALVTESEWAAFVAATRST